MNASAGPLVRIFEPSVIIGRENIEFGRYVIIDSFVLIQAKRETRIGDHVHIASFTSITGGGELVMEDFSTLSSGVRVVTGTDDYKGWGFGNSTVAGLFRNLNISRVTLGRFAIVGANSVILPGVDIGEGASVGAGSVVTKSLDAWGIYIGTRKVGERPRQEILENYERFRSTDEAKRIGDVFRI